MLTLRKLLRVSSVSERPLKRVWTQRFCHLTYRSNNDADNHLIDLYTKLYHPNIHFSVTSSGGDPYPSHPWPCWPLTFPYYQPTITPTPSLFHFNLFQPVVCIKLVFHHWSFNTKLPPSLFLLYWAVLLDWEFPPSTATRRNLRRVRVTTIWFLTHQNSFITRRLLNFRAT